MTSQSMWIDLERALEIVGESPASVGRYAFDVIGSQVTVFRPDDRGRWVEIGRCDVAKIKRDAP